MWGGGKPFFIFALITTFSLVSCAAYQRAPKLEDLLKEAQLTDEEAGTTTGTPAPPIPMITVPTNGTPIKFPGGEDNSGTGIIKHKFAMAQTETTYKLWKKVYDWATDSSVTCGDTGVPAGKGCYTFANKGKEGRDGTAGATPTATKNEPVTNVSWNDMVVWSNAYTEWYNAEKGGSLTVVYKNGSTILRDSTQAVWSLAGGTFDPTSNTATGFRLPTEAEWEFAARLRKDNTNTVANNKPAGVNYPIDIGGTEYWFTKGDSASGATAGYNNVAATGKVAWYRENSCDSGSGCHQNSSGNKKSKPRDVATKDPNALGLFDMSGNVWEFCFDGGGTVRNLLGQSYENSAYFLRIARRSNTSVSATDDHVGFRVVRTQ